MNKIFSAESFKQYLFWQQHDEETLRKINLLIKSIECDGVGKGLGEPLKHGDGYSRPLTITIGSFTKSTNAVAWT